MASKTVLVTAANGHIGTELVPALLKDNVKLVLPTRNAQRLKETLPPHTNDDVVLIEQGDVKDPWWVEKILKAHNVDTVFLCLTLTDELITTLNFFDAMKRAGTVKHLVYLSAAGDFVSEEGLDRTLKINTGAHVVIKPLIERKLKVSDFPWTHTVLGPSYFWDNDLLAKDSVLRNGFFNVPTVGGVGGSRVSAADIAAVAHKAILQPEKLASKKIMIGSLHNYTAEETEKLWSAALGKDVKLMAVDDKTLDRFEQIYAGIEKPRMGDMAVPWARDLRMMFSEFAQHGFGMTKEDHDLQVEVLGREPLKYEDFVKDTAKEWLSSQ